LEDYHLHSFKLHGRHYRTTWTGVRHREAAGREVTLADLQLRMRQRIHYEYEFGDLWAHESRLRPSSSGGAARSTRSALPARVPARPTISAVRGAMMRSFDRLRFSGVERHFFRGEQPAPNHRQDTSQAHLELIHF
jgi:hypothetical protein